MKRKTLYVLIFLGFFFYIERNTYYSESNSDVIEPFKSVYYSLSEITDGELFAMILTALFPCILIWILFDNLLKRLDKK